MPKTVSELSKERQLVLLCSRGNLKAEHEVQIREIVSGVVDWKEVAYQCVSHRTLTLMYYHLCNLELADCVEKEVQRMMRTESIAYGLRNKVFFEEIKRIFEKLNESGVKVAILKGNYLAANVYPAVQTRAFNDLDFLLDPKDGDRVVKILEELGYAQGNYNEKTGEITPMSRKEKIFHQMNTNELPECMKRTDNPFIEILPIDLNLDILWKGNCPCKIETSELLERAIQEDIFGAKVYVLDREDFLIQLSCHLYKEATILNWISSLRDMLIYKFADILMYVEKFNKEIDWNKLIETCQRTNVGKFVYYAFYYVEVMYGQVIPAHVMEALEPEDKEYLDEYGVENEKPSKWEFDFFTRMFETSRIMQLSEEALAKKKNFWDTKNKFKQS